MRFRCLVMDHDDTTVNSTATIHFPSFLAYLKLVRPEASYTLEDYFRKNFDPGIMALFTGELGFSEQELEGEFRFWQDWVRTRVPCAYPGIREILQRHKDAGGYIAVVSHSMRGSIERDDFIGVEFAFAAHLARSERTEDERLFRLAFEREHLFAWLPAYGNVAVSVAGTELFRGLLAFLSAYAHEA